ncbi:MAG: hypothetical protein PHS54_05665 [Clostridia bacterium]|nr:hypothetical protein [Clostridia bacterium]
MSFPSNDICFCIIVLSRDFDLFDDVPQALRHLLEKKNQKQSECYIKTKLAECGKFISLDITSLSNTNLRSTLYVMLKEMKELYDNTFKI